MESVRNGSLLLSVPTAWRFAEGSRCPLSSGKVQKAKVPTQPATSAQES